MATRTVVAQNVNGDPATSGGNINIVNGATTQLVFNEVDGELGNPVAGETISVNGGPPQTYEYLGTGYVRGNDSAAFIRLTDGTTFALDLSSATNPNLKNGNTKLKVNDLDVGSSGFPVCFKPGTLLATPGGDRSVETLAPGDLLMTADHGPQPVRWIGTSKHAWPGTDDKHKPIQIKAGALGNGLPSRDLSVSPQNRIVMAGPLVEKMFGTPEVLALAKGMTGLPGVRVMKGKKDVSYISILTDRHQILTAEGAPTESFYPGPTALGTLSPGHTDEIRALFPALAEDPDHGYGPHARRVLTRRETADLVKAIRAAGEHDGAEEATTTRRAHLSLIS